MKSIFTCCLLLFVTACFKVDEKISDSHISAPTSYLWKANFPQVMYLADGYDDPVCGTTRYHYDFCEEADPQSLVTSTMASKWNEVFPQTSFLAIRDTSLPSGFKRTYSSIKEINNDGYNGLYTLDQDQWKKSNLGDSILGAAILLGRTNEFGQYIIHEGDILINDAQAIRFNLGTILLHELGHFIGLQHMVTDDKLDTVMYPSIGTLDIKQKPTDIDKRTLAKLYQLSGSTSQNSRRREVADGRGSEIRIIFELGADKTCRHLIDGELVHSHTIDL